jgi:hypothetical protein
MPFDGNGNFRLLYDFEVDALAQRSNVFISYRRDDAPHAAGRIYERLARHLDRERFFMDIATIELGVDFIRSMMNELARSAVLLAIIGPRWLDARNQAGRRRLEDAHDLVRMEISKALEWRIRVIPILLDGTTMPKAEQLPPDIKALSKRNALPIRHASFNTDIAPLVHSLRKLIGTHVRHTPHLKRTRELARLQRRNKRTADIDVLISQLRALAPKR